VGVRGYAEPNELRADVCIRVADAELYVVGRDGRFAGSSMGAGSPPTTRPKEAGVSPATTGDLLDRLHSKADRSPTSSPTSTT
jgi:hypothetical protein